MAFYIEWLQKPLTTMFPVTETQSSTRPQRLLNVLHRERILKADSSDVLAKFSRKISSLLARNSFVRCLLRKPRVWFPLVATFEIF